jgi:hypothetical protein
LKKPIKQEATPQTWDADILFAKAQRYFERMQSADSEGWEHALFSTFALEFLVRAALANISPAFLADQSDKNWSNLSHSLGFPPKISPFIPKSIPTQEALKRLMALLAPEFDKENSDFCAVHIGKRNAELHSGEMSFDGVASATWQPSFYRASKVLLNSMGYELSDVLGVQEAKVAEILIKSAADKAAKAILGDVEAHKKVWQAKDSGERSKLSTAASTWATKQVGHRVPCPACGSDAVVNGPAVSLPKKTIEDDEITEVQDHLPARFECIACGLKISGLSKISAVGLGARYKKTQVYDAADYYAPHDEYYGYEEDNNEP